MHEEPRCVRFLARYLHWVSPIATMWCGVPACHPGCHERTHSCILVDLKARSAKGARFLGVDPGGRNSQCSNVCLWRTFAKNSPERKWEFSAILCRLKSGPKHVSARGQFLQKCAIDRHLSTENFSLWDRPPESEHLWLNVLLNPPKYTNGFDRTSHHTGGTQA